MTRLVRSSFLVFSVLSAACAVAPPERGETAEDPVASTPVVGSAGFVGDWQIPFCAAGLPPATFSGETTDIIGLTLHEDGTYVARVPASTTRECDRDERCLDAIVGRWTLRSIPSSDRLVLRPTSGQVLELGVSQGHVIQTNAPPVLTPGAAAATVEHRLLYPVREFGPDACQVCADGEELVPRGDEPRHCRLLHPRPVLPLRAMTFTGGALDASGAARIDVADDAEIVSVGVDADPEAGIVDVTLEHDGKVALLATIHQRVRVKTLVDDFHGARTRGAWTLTVRPRHSMPPSPMTSFKLTFNVRG
jgi:hypothetical protein